MRLSQTDHGDETNVKVEGTLDKVTAPEFRPLIDGLVAHQRDSVTLELSGLSQIDSAGVGVIVDLAKRVRAYGGHVKIVGIKDQPRAMFRLLRLDRIFPL